MSILSWTRRLVFSFLNSQMGEYVANFQLVCTSMDGIFLKVNKIGKTNNRSIRVSIISPKGMHSWCMNLIELSIQTTENLYLIPQNI